MRTYTVTEYAVQDYDDYKNNITLTEIINNLKHKTLKVIGKEFWHPPSGK